jgi:hypothetical protein
MDGVLINEYRYEILEVHRMKLLHNLMRIDVRAGNWQGVMELGSSLFDELAGSSCLWLTKLCEQELLPSNILEDIAVFFANKFLEEMAQALAQNRGLELVALFSHIRPFSEDTAVENLDLFSCVYKWLHVKRAFVDGDDREFLDRASSFLAGGRPYSGLLWHATVYDIVSLCRRLNAPAAFHVSETLIEDACTFRLPPLLQLSVP